MTSNEDIVLDPRCGISEEEQLEILAKINGITEKNRRSLAAGAAEDPSGQKPGAESKKGKKQHSGPGFKAQKSGGLFPIVVNAAAIAVLAGGLIALYAFQGKTNVQVREGAKVYNSAERALIEEMRREMASHDGAFNEMEQLSREQSQAATVEAQMGAFFANLNGAIDENRIEDAAEIVKSMRSFLNTPAFQTLRSIQARKDLYAQAINSAETMIDALSSGQLSLDTESQQLLADLQEKNAQLEHNVELLSSGADQMVKNLQTQIGDLRDENKTLGDNKKSLEADVSTKETRINSLETENSQLSQRVERRENALKDIQTVMEGKPFMERSISELQDSVDKIEQALR